MGGNQDKGDGAVAGSHPTQQLQAVHLRHHHIGENQIHLGGGQQLQSRKRSGGGQGLKTQFAQPHLQQKTFTLLIIDHQDGCSLPVSHDSTSSLSSTRRQARRRRAKEA